MVDTEQRDITQTVESFYEANKDLGVKDLGGGTPTQLPQIKLTQKLSKNYLSDGSLAHEGKFYNSETKEESDFIDCHICVIKKTYIKSQFKTKSGADKKMTYILGAMVAEEGSTFLTFLKGTALPFYWKFQKELLEKIEKMKTPMFAFYIRLGVAEIDSPYGKLAVIKPEFILDENGQPKRLDDLNMLEAVKEQVLELQTVINKIGSSGESFEGHYASMADEEPM